MTVMTETKNPFLASLETSARARHEDEPAWLAELRRQARAELEAQDFPTTKHEEWRFTDVSPILKTQFAPAEQAAAPSGVVEEAVFGRGDAFRLVFVNGRMASELSSESLSEEGIQLASIGRTGGDGQVAGTHLDQYVDTATKPFAALNTAFFEDAAVIQVRPGAVISRPVHVLFLTVPGEAASIIHPRVLVHAGANSQVTVIEGYYGQAGGAPYFNNAVTELVADENAVIEHVRLQQDSLDGYHIGTMRIHQGRDSTVTSHSVALGGRLVRNEVLAKLAGEGSDCTLNGLFVETGRQHVDNHLRVEHAAPHTRSWEYYKGILADTSRGVFTGRIYVHPGAQKTDAKQTNMNLLLSDFARVNTKPQLEIFADDVKCTHGATIGQLDADAMFYLRSRGLTEKAARDFLIYAFASECIQQIKLESIRKELERILFERLSENPPGGDTDEHDASE